MIGFIKGLFSFKPKRNIEEFPQPKDAFYLPDDDAKTFGDIDYMRSSKRTRRTFPKQAVGENNEFFNEVSSTKKSDRKDQPTFNSPFNTLPLNSSQAASQPSESSSSNSSSSTNSAERRRSDPGMDMFRNMARDIKKKG